MDLDKKLEALQADVTELKVSDAKKTVILEQIREDLRYHVKRTTQVEAFMQKWAGVWTALGVVGILAGIGASIAKIMGAF
jgi:flagellar motor component MotA